MPLIWFLFVSIQNTGTLRTKSAAPLPMLICAVWSFSISLLTVSVVPRRTVASDKVYLVPVMLTPFKQASSGMIPR